MMTNEDIVDEIITRVSNMTDTRVEDMESPWRYRPVSDARTMAISLIKKHTRLTLAQIGGYFNRNHATVMAAIKRSPTIAAQDKIYRGIYNEIDNYITFANQQQEQLWEESEESTSVTQ